jgi:hypothetical protein
MISNHHLFEQNLQVLEESWSEFSRTIYIHKLETNSLPEHVSDSLDELIKIGVLKDKKEVYIYSFIHPDGNNTVSFVGPTIFKPRQSFMTWYAYVNPLRGLLYKGGMDAFSSEVISKPQFETVSFLSAGEKVKFKKVAEINTKAISTTIPLAFPFISVFYENIRMKCADKNKLGIQSIQFKKLKVFTLPQMFLKSNYVFTYQCNIT